MSAPLLVLACGNPDRGDDGLGPAFAERAAQAAEPGRVEVVVDYQFQLEHALDLQGRKRVLFVDACASGPEPFSCQPVAPARDHSFSSHRLSAAALLAAFASAYGDAGLPPAELLAIRGYEFGLGAPASARARDNLERALEFFTRWAGAGGDGRHCLSSA